MVYKRFIGDTRGWIEIKKNELEKANFLDSISSSSYIKGNYVYLDEDLDFSFFVCLLGYEPDFVNIYVDDTYFNNYKTFKENLQ